MKNGKIAHKERCILKQKLYSFLGIAGITMLACGVGSMYDAHADVARSSLNSSLVHARGGNEQSSPRQSANDNSANAGVSRTMGITGRVSARGAITSNAMRGASSVARSASRSATVVRNDVSPTTSARSAVSSGASRATPARATAVFNDISKIGGGYAQCRESYATCMDQFCANANDTYRRCFCSARFTEFRDTEDALAQAKTLLMQFEDNNLNAVDKTAAEVNAMYSATVGEAAIKKDTSAAAKILDQIGDLLSGKKKSTSTYSSGSLGVLSLDISTDVDDIWNGGGDSIFSSTGGVNLADLEGDALYKASNKQCTSLVGDSCESNAVLQMARSSYSIMITQDCNAYAKKIDSQREAVKQTVRTAEKYLREARLEEYRSHNSADVNECLNKVKTAILADTACGANYKRCLDYTGAYINQTTGEPIYSQRLFELNDVIKLAGVSSGGDTDVLKQNDAFDKFLDTKRMFAASALDTCRDIANTVWTEFKRTALIEIAQAQDEKIEEVKMSCVSTMAECYDTQSSALKDFDDTTAKKAGAISAYAAREMCKEKVNACASLYGEPNECKFDGNGKLTSGGKNGPCGISELLEFVDTVDKTRITEACETTLQKYVKDLCTPKSGDNGYPWACRSLSTVALKANLNAAFGTYCPNTEKNMGPSSDQQQTIVSGLVNEVTSGIMDSMYTKCASLGGLWLTGDQDNANYLKSFYTSVYGDNRPPRKSENDEGLLTEYGICVKNDIRSQCEQIDTIMGGKGYATYNAAQDMCVFSNDWYKQRCEGFLGGYWENGVCYVLGEKL